MNSLVTFFKRSSFYMLFSAVMMLKINPIHAQYEKNPMPRIQDDKYEMTVKKFVRIPDDDSVRPRINCFTFYGDRIFISTETGGKIYEIVYDSATHVYNPRLFFDVKSAIAASTGRQLSAIPTNFHSGLRSVAFHPEFSINGKFYTSLMEERPADTAGHHYLSDVSNPITADGVVVEWTYDFDQDTVDVNSYRELFRVGVPQYDHPMKQIAFNPYAKEGDEDYGLLYIGHGDGNRYNSPEYGGQRNDARGKILRINPLETDTTPYSIPPGNPFVNDTTWLDEIYATGFRNPHSLAFVKDDTGAVHLIVSNAGRDNIEEIQVVNKGENYGWSYREGTYVHLQAGGLNTGIQALPDDEVKNNYVYPSAQWSRADPLLSSYSGKSIVGGYLYTVKKTGERLFLSADFPQSGTVMYNKLDDLLNAVTKLDSTDTDRDQPEELAPASFKVVHVLYDDDGDTTTSPLARNNMLDVINDDPDFDNSGRADLRFGRDKNENIYITSKRNGWIYMIESITPPASTDTGNVDTVDNSNREVQSTIRIYPNPASVHSQLRLMLQENNQDAIFIKLISSEGREVVSKTIHLQGNQYVLNLGDFQLEPGFYLLRIQSGQTTVVQSLLLQ